MESLKKAAVRAGVVVATYGVDFLVHRDGASADRYGCFEDEQLTAEFAIAPIDDNDRALSTCKEHGGERAVDSRAFTVQMLIAEQAVDGLDVVFDEGITATCPAEMGQREFPAIEERLDDPQECTLSGTVADDGIAFEPGIQQANGVHAALSDSGGSVVTTIRSDGSVHVDPLILCFHLDNCRNSWGYISKALQLTANPLRGLSAAELGRCVATTHRDKH